MSELSPRFRILRAYAVTLLAVIVAIGFWISIRRESASDSTPVFFRKALELNGRIWSALQSTRAARSEKRPRPGHSPRINGVLGLESPIDLASWRVEAWAGDYLAEAAHDPANRRQFSLAELKSLAKSDTAFEFKCIEGWSEVMSFGGVKFSEFMTYAKVGTRSGRPFDPADPASVADLFKYVALVTPDGEYYVSIDMESMLHPQTLLAYEMNETPLAILNGAPLRLAIPIKYGIKNLKRVGKIYFSDTRPPDYWAEDGYDWFAGL